MSSSVSVAGKTRIKTMILPAQTAKAGTTAKSKNNTDANVSDDNINIQVQVTQPTCNIVLYKLVRLITMLLVCILISMTMTLIFVLIDFSISI